MDLSQAVANLHGITTTIGNQRREKEKQREQLEAEIAAIKKQRSDLAYQYSKCSYDHLSSDLLTLLTPKQATAVQQFYPNCIPFLDRLGIRICDIISRQIVPLPAGHAMPTQVGKEKELNILDIIRQCIVMDSMYFTPSKAFIAELKEFYANVIRYQTVQLVAKMDKDKKQIKLSVQTVLADQSRLKFKGVTADAVDAALLEIMPKYARILSLLGMIADVVDYFLYWNEFSRLVLTPCTD